MGKTTKVILECCANCRHEETCGYSHKANLGYRTEYSHKQCCLGERSYGDGKFFEVNKK